MGARRLEGGQMGMRKEGVVVAFSSGPGIT